MKKLLLLLLLVPMVSFGQTSQVTVYDISGNNLGTFRVESNYAQRNSNNLRMAMQDYINYLKNKENKRAAAAELKELNARAAKFGMSVSGIGKLGGAATSGYLNVVEAQARQRIANGKYARELGYSSYAELVRVRKKRKAAEKAKNKREKAAKTAARKARPSKKERKANAIADEIAWKKIKQNEEIRAARKANNLKLESLITERNTLYKEGNYKESLLKANEIISYEPSANNYNWRGFIKRYLEDYEGSITDYSKAIEIDPLDEVMYFNRGRVRYVSSDLEGSIVDYSKAIELKKTFDGYFWRGRARLDIKEYYKAIPDFMSALELNPNENDKAAALFYLAKTKHELNDTAGAIEGYNQVLSINPDDSRAKYALLSIKYFPRLNALYEKEGRSDKWRKLMIEQLYRTIKIYPEEISLYRSIIEENISLRNYEEVIKYSVTFLKLSNKQGKEITARDYNQIAASYRNTKKLYEAISFYNKALEIDPLYPTAIGGLGTTKLYLGDVNGACEDWNKAINLEKIQADSKQLYSGLITENCK
jgi:tetratricopeptide (TPR) repeat protein